MHVVPLAVVTDRLPAHALQHEPDLGVDGDGRRVEGVHLERQTVQRERPEREVADQPGGLGAVAPAEHLGADEGDAVAHRRGVLVEVPQHRLADDDVVLDGGRSPSRRGPCALRARTRPDPRLLTGQRHERVLLAARVERPEPVEMLGTGRFEPDQPSLENRLVAQHTDVDHDISQPTTASVGKRARRQRAYRVLVVLDAAEEPDYLRANRANWDDRAAIHAASPDYEVQSFLDDPNTSPAWCGSTSRGSATSAGLDGVHLQCHIGTDTLSLARLGARMTGLDLSPQSVEEARRLAAATGAEVDYVVSDVYDAPRALAGRTFDLVYVSLGAISWLPSVDRWAEVVAAVLRPGGRLFIRDTHPMLDTMEPDPVTGRPVPAFPYFEHHDPVVWDDDLTYVQAAEDSAHTITHTETHTWSHGIGETVTAVMRHGLQLTMLEEHDSVPFCPFPGKMTRDEIGEFRMTEHPERIAMSFTLGAVKPCVSPPGPGSVTVGSPPSALLGLHRGRRLGQDREQVADDAEVDELEDRRLLVLVDGDDRLGRLHAGPVLDRARDAAGDVELRRHLLAGLADLRRVRVPAGVHGRPRGPHGGAERVGEVLDLGEVARRAAATRHDDGRLGQLRPAGLLARGGRGDPSRLRRVGRRELHDLLDRLRLGLLRASPSSASP